MDFLNLDLLFPFLMKAAEKVIDTAIDGQHLNMDQQGAVQMGYAAAVTFGDRYVKRTENTMDDQALATFKKLCEDTAEEGNFPLPVLSIPTE